MLYCLYRLEAYWHTAMHSLRLQRLLWIYCPGHAGVSGNERADRLASTADITSAAWQVRGAQRLEELSQHGQARASQHWPPKGKRSGERKRPTFHPPRPRTICVQPGKYWHCFEGNLGETAERRGGARMGLSERYDAILSWNWSLHLCSVVCFGSKLIPYRCSVVYIGSKPMSMLCRLFSFWRYVDALSSISALSTCRCSVI